MTILDSHLTRTRDPSFSTLPVLTPVENSRYEATDKMPNTIAIERDTIRLRTEHRVRHDGHWYEHYERPALSTLYDMLETLARIRHTYGTKRMRVVMRHDTPRRPAMLARAP